MAVCVRYFCSALFIDTDSSEIASNSLTETVTFVYDEIGEPVARQLATRQEVCLASNFEFFDGWTQYGMGVLHLVIDSQ